VETLYILTFPIHASDKKLAIILPSVHARTSSPSSILQVTFRNRLILIKISLFKEVSVGGFKFKNPYPKNIEKPLK